jgi:dihydrofolate reductase
VAAPAGAGEAFDSRAVRKLIYSMLTSLDLYVEGPDGQFGWATPDAELHKHFNANAATMTTHLYGRRMWEMLSAYWPTAESDPAATPEAREFARFWNAGEHIVFSRSLRTVEHGARLLRDGAVEAVRRLKSGEGTDMDVGGPGLAATLIEAGVVDEIHVYLNPVVVGGGKPFFSGLKGRLDLRLLGVQTFAGGVVQVRYAVRTTGT